MTRHALVVAPDYPPTNRMSSLRAYFIARALIAAGYSVHVLAEPPGTTNAGLPRPESGVSVTRIAAPHRAAWLAKAAWQVMRMVRRGQAMDVIVSSSGPFLAHLVAALGKSRWRRAVWAADYRDLWSTGSYYRDEPFSGLGLHTRHFLERAILKRADLVTTVSRGLRDNLSAFHKREVLVFHNGFEADANSGGTPLRQDGRIQICHTGLLYQERSPLPVLRALEMVDPSGGIRLIMSGTSDAAVTQTLCQYSGKPFAKHLGTLPRSQAYELQRSSDFCLLLEEPNATRKGVITGKVFEYIGMRKPIIAYGVADDSELAEILRRTGLLAFCGSEPDELVNFLSRLRDGAFEGVVADEAYIAGFDRTAISASLVNAIEVRALSAGAC